VQLRQVCLEHNATSAWTIALRSTERRKRQPGLTKPGAWFNSVCVRELEKRGVHVPKKADTDELAEVRALLAAQFGGAE
jgi:hypothetical protein